MHRISTIRWWQLAVLCAPLTLSSLDRAQAETVILNSVADTYLRDALPRGAFIFVDVRGDTLDFRSYVRFDLSGIPAGSTISSATLGLFQVGGASRNDDILAARFAAYGLNNVAGNTPQDWDEATFVIAAKGTENVTTLMGVTDLDDDVAGISETIAGTAASGVITVSGAPLADFLQTRFSDGGLTTFILSNDDATDRGYGLGTKENADSATFPTLTVEYQVPEPSALAIVAVSTAVLLRRRRGTGQKV